MREDLWIIVEATCRHRFVERIPDGTPIRDPYCALGLVCGPDSCPVLAAAERVMERLDRPIYIGTIGGKK